MSDKMAALRRSVAKQYEVGREEAAETAAAPVDTPEMLVDLGAEVALARRSSLALSIAVVSLTGAGTRNVERRRRCLQRLMQLMTKGFRHTDQCGLLGEEEILAVLPGTDEEGARRALGRVFDAGFGKTAKSLDMRICCGLAELESFETSAVTLLDRARSLATDASLS